MTSPNGIFSEAPGRLPLASLKRLARTAGVFYLAVGIPGGFSAGFVDPSLHVARDAAATTGNEMANPGLVRLGVAVGVRTPRPAHPSPAQFAPVPA
ncbi:hypothetical protein E2F48_02500 [Arthrobacter crusticola]|uniref:DUF4386 family protein n=1 Tax=Arthrobacter crusticola TaxID=2547960 RepID=A0A4R5U323_9MICC|nr:DUF4386 family protein [Arthrobacter crusticola]TDK27993.1 hypothetical protein E2F48_02500 [Arthrobacter crusticola]